MFDRIGWFEKLIVGKKGREVVITTDASSRLVPGSTASHGVPYTLFLSTEEKNNSGADETTFHSVPVEPFVIPNPGQCICIFGTFHCTNSLGTKVLKVYIDATELATITSPQSVALAQTMEGQIYRVDDTTLHAHIRLFDCDGATGALGTQWAEFHTTVTVAAGVSFVFKTTGTAADSSRHHQDIMLLRVRP